jgi:Domain of unknown function (DUF4157)
MTDVATAVLRLSTNTTNRQLLAGAPSLLGDVAPRGGQQLDQAAREHCERYFGHDFSDVRVHADDQAADAARALNARAYTIGREIVFGAGQFAPQSDAGRRLLVHELTHVVQQHGAHPGRATAFGRDDDPAEREADAASSGVATGRFEPVTPRVFDDRPTLRRVTFGNDGALSARRQATVRAAAQIAERLVTGGGGIASFQQTWDAFWKGPGARITPRLSLASYQAAVQQRVVHSMDTSADPDVKRILTEEASMPLERQTPGVTKVGAQNTYLREFAIDQGVDAIVSLLLHESLHGAGLSMGPAMLYEPFLHQFESDVGFPMMMGGADIVEIKQVRVGAMHIDATVTYNLRRIGKEPLSEEIELQVVSPESGQIITQEERDLKRHEVRARLPSKVGKGTWVWHARWPGWSPVHIRLVAGTNTLLASAKFNPNPRCELGVSTMHCEGD